MNGKRMMKENLVALSAMLAAGSFVLGSVAPTVAAAPAASELTLGKQKLTQGKVTEAITLLKKAVQKQPNNCECRLNLGRALCKKAQADKAAKNTKAAEEGFIAARTELRKAIRLGKGNQISKQANQVLMANIPAELLKPRTGEGTEMIAAVLGVRGRDRGIGDAKPKVFEFYADWCEPCKMLKPVLDKVKSQYGDQIEFVSYNVDDEKNAKFLDQYEVSPIPTVIFLSPDNQVVGYTIGFSGEKQVQKNIDKILLPQG